jgi:hypothetical protein
MIFVVAIVCLSFGTCLGLLIGGIMGANQHSRELEMVGDDAYADGYEQRLQDERAGIQSLPTHRP